MDRAKASMNAVFPLAKAVRTTCPYCGVGCGVLAAPEREGGAAISGDPGHPANFGRLCSKGTALGETLSLDQRLLHPMLRRADGSLFQVDWDTALDTVAGDCALSSIAMGRAQSRSICPGNYSPKITTLPTS